MLTLFNLLGAKLFGEIEFWFAIIKIITIVAIILLGLVIILFGIHTYYGQASFTNLAQYQGLFPHGSFGF